MVQRKVPNKLGIKPDHLKSDTQLVNLRPSSPQTHDLKKIMKKSRPIKRPDSDALRSSPPFRKKRTQPDGAGSTAATPQKQSPNYMKSTSSFEARKERSPSVSSRVSPLANKTPSPKVADKSKTHSSGSGHKASRTSLKVVRTLTKSPSFKLSRPSKKCSSVILCEDLDAQSATCSSTLKDSTFPNYLELSPGGTELEGTSAMKVCPYTYCSLNGHHHAPLPPLRCFLSARRRALKTQKSFKLGCLSPRQKKPVVKKNEETVRGPVIFAEEAPEVDVKSTPIIPLMDEESRDFFVEIYSKDEEGKGIQDSECPDIDWEEGYCSASCLDDGQTFKSQEIDGDVCEEQVLKTGVESSYGGLQELYDEESVSSGAWLEEDGDCDSDSSYQQMKINHQSEDQSSLNYDAFAASSTTTEADGNDEMDKDKITNITGGPEATSGCEHAAFEAKNDELQGLNLPIGDHDIKGSIDYRQEETSQEPETAPDFGENSQNGTNKQRTIIYNIIQFNISVFINGEKKEHSETDKGVVVQVPVTVAADKMETEEVNDAKLMVGLEASELAEEQGMSNEGGDIYSLTTFDDASEVNQMVAYEGLPLDAQDIVSNEQLDASYVAEKQDGPEKECNECEAYSRSNSMGSEDDKHSEHLGLQVTEQGDHATKEMDEEHASRSDDEQTHFTGEITSDANRINPSLCKKQSANEGLLDPSINLRGATRGKKPDQEMKDSREFNPRGPNFLPEVLDPDAETVDLRHQMMDERKNAEEWMVDFALQQAVTTLAPARKRKVALLVEAFEKVMPIPEYETHNRHTSKAFTNARPMQACS